MIASQNAAGITAPPTHGAQTGTEPIAEKVFQIIKDDLIVALAALKGVNALIQTSEFTESCTLLGSAQILLRNSMAQFDSIYNEVDLAVLRKFNKTRSAA